MSESALSDVNILLVDDEVFAQRFADRILKSIGIGSVTFADDAESALEILGNSETPFDLVISDIQMPGMDGYEFVRKIRFGAVPDYQAVPILMLTGQDSDKNAQNARIHKISGYIIKPPKAPELETEIKSALGL